MYPSLWFPNPCLSHLPCSPHPHSLHVAVGDQKAAFGSGSAAFLESRRFSEFWWLEVPNGLPEVPEWTKIPNFISLGTQWILKVGSILSHWTGQYMVLTMLATHLEKMKWHIYILQNEPFVTTCLNTLAHTLLELENLYVVLIHRDSDGSSALRPRVDVMRGDILYIVLNCFKFLL